MENEWTAPEFIQCSSNTIECLLHDGSILKGCIPQMDGDIWWDGIGKEVFFDPMYEVKAWRYSAED